MVKQKNKSIVMSVQGNLKEVHKRLTQLFGFIFLNANT